FHKSDIQNRIQQALSPLLEAKGFAYAEHPKYLQFKKTYKGGFQSCLFSTHQHENTFWIEMSVGVRVDIVEKIANQFTLTLKDYHQDSHTILTTYGRIMGTPYFRFKVESEADLKGAFEKMQAFLEEIAFDFMDDNSIVANIDKLINRYPEKPSRFIYNNTHRCIKGVIVAQIAQNPQLQTLIKAYHIVMERHPLRDKMLPQYEKLVEYLQAFSVN
ncbi:MAG: hypothetical protein ACPGVB_16315, partial [Chitinophagales bacterium]